MLCSNSQLDGKWSYHAEQKYKTLPNTINVFVIKTQKKFQKDLKLERSMIGMQVVENGLLWDTS